MVAVDAAGAAMGGASRLLVELRRYLSEQDRHDILLLGADRSLDLPWLLQREVAARGVVSRIALNNVAFVAGGARRSVLLRNALHFPVPDEEYLLPTRARRQVAVEARVVRMAARRADVLVAPSSGMAERVQRWLPSVATRLVVWPHPVSPRTSAEPRVPGLVLCPVLLAPYKKMGRWLRLLARAAELVRAEGSDVRIEVTATEGELSAEGLGGLELVALGRLSVVEVERALTRASVIFYPTTVESFGYPLAEARVNGQAVLGADTPHNREVAGSALVPFVPDVDGMARALALALTREVVASTPESPVAYFDRLLAQS